jgi:uncharacterized Zn finger protein
MREIVRMALGGEKCLGGLLFHGVPAEGRVAELLERLEGKAQFAEQTVPSGFQGELRPYQRRGYSWLAFLKEWGLGACLADDMGLGKTIQALALIQRDWESNGRQPVLLICPTSVVANWQKETARFCPGLPVLVHHGARLQRGRSYARRGQALSIDIEKGVVRARVQGSRPQPYNVTIKMKTLGDAQWQKLEKALAKKPIHAAKLEAGEMPQDIEEVFRNASVPLFPETSRDLETDCSCPDWSNPCKHIAAVYYLLGEEFDRNPFLIFKLRGHTREELVSGMKVPAAPAGPVPTLPGEPLPADPTVFWHGAPVPDDLYGEVQIPQVHAALPKRLGHFPFWRSELDAAVAPVFSSLLLESKGNGLPAAVSAPHYWHIEKTGNKYAKLLTYVSSSRYYMYRSIY